MWCEVLVRLATLAWSHYGQGSEFVLAASSVQNSATTSTVPSSYVVPGAFPTSLYSHYYNNPTATSAQPQPVISDPVTHEIFPFSLTDPQNIPQNDTVDPHPLPPQASSQQLLQQAVAQIKSIAVNPMFTTSCARCQASLEVAKFLALAAPEQGTNLALTLCEYFDYSSSCEKNYGPLVLGPILTQVASFADVGGYDGQSICSEFLGLCPAPTITTLNLTGWFAKPKPNPLPPPKQPSGQLMKVLHLSDLHIDARYANGAEANCTSGLCCRDNAYNSLSPETPLFPAPRYGSFLCDAPYSLITSILEAIPPLTGTESTGFDFSLFTGDLLAHDPDNQQSRAMTEYSEVVLYDLLKRMLGSGPTYATLGNHDTCLPDQASPSSLGGALGQQFSWLYDHVTALWEQEGWLPEASVEFSRTHYAAYMVKRADGLRVISLDTNLWYRSNYFNYINSSEPDVSGILRFLTDELQDAEDAGDRVWIIGHVVSGWDGSNSMPNPTNLFYQIVDRFSPHVIANIFWGHTHEDQLSIFYANNGTNISAETAQAVSWTGPSVTPLTNLNSGFRVYEIDSATFEVVDAYTWKSYVNDYPALDSQTQFGPTFEFEYSTREAYGGNITWGATDPLNATWWHLVTEQMEVDPTLMEAFNSYQGKGSILTPPCTGECIPARICYIRSGSASIAKQNCISGYGSVQ
ncbi:sphingomyelin phosphodiesterase [Suillus plorans]|uniref:Sphingomyelin phosphodiesterase n=1 Tax=Suillus plorans TaxID=116603 RepID=A0A9P7ARC7_9AGAM|nr:sphingomyelin phosphodiesterase [Suillus plorans]KAG1794909.1 sphingomyelin phosphodiesterase [Suillus plorans]